VLAERIAEVILTLLALGVLALTVALVVGATEGSPAAQERRFWQQARARNEARFAAEQSWVDSGAWPLTHYQVYVTDWELVEDLARLKAMGYSVEWQEHVAEGVAVTYSLTPAYQRGKPKAAPMS
jgi:hypothetical protein